MLRQKEGLEVFKEVKVATTTVNVARITQVIQYNKCFFWNIENMANFFANL